ncbi:MAG: NADH-quinone oxidoreductase subunit A [Phycisphaeraceae bacterium]|nr:NADH-quinone oxidoreductase subunit A [Phycisphaeraceae bacterium]
MTPLLSITLFLLVGLGFVLVNLTIGRFLRPRAPHPDKASIYECGEPSIGTNWVQFDLRFYMVALFFLVFDVELALIYPWAVVFRDMPGVALLLGLPFLGLILIGYIYEWYSGSLEWVRSGINRPDEAMADDASSQTPSGLAALARRDPETLSDIP